MSVSKQGKECLVGVLSHSLFLLGLHYLHVALFPFLYEDHLLRHAQTRHCSEFHYLFSHKNLRLNFVTTSRV